MAVGFVLIVLKYIKLYQGSSIRGLAFVRNCQSFGAGPIIYDIYVKLLGPFAKATMCIKTRTNSPNTTWH